MIVPFLILIGVVYLLLKDDKGIKFNTHQNSPEQKLKERYVHGEIDEETYLRMKSVINQR